MAFDSKTGNALEPNTVGSQDCEEPSVGGRPSTRYDYIPKNHNEDTLDSLEDLDIEVCEPWYYYNTRIGDLQVDENILVGGNINASGTVTAPTFQGNINVQSWKGFDILHPNKENHRLRHICLEGPEAGVYIRGKGKGKIIEIPDYWKGLIDENSISVHLTPYGNSYVLFVEKIEDNKIYIESNWEVSGTDIEYYYMINASRIDGEKLIVEYEGQTPADYPGNSKQFSISGYDYDVRG